MKTILYLFVILLLVSCAAPRMMETNLYFGLSKPAGGMVSDTEWKDFKVNHITKIFKEGYTVINVTGGWFDPDKKKLIEEPAYKVIYLYKKSSSLSNQIDSLREQYKIFFQQQAVLRIDKKVRASF